MKLGFGLPAAFLLVAMLAMLCSGCVVQRTVTQGGQTVSSGYAVKRPFSNSQDY